MCRVGPCRSESWAITMAIVLCCGRTARRLIGKQRLDIDTYPLVYNWLQWQARGWGESFGKGWRQLDFTLLQLTFRYLNKVYGGWVATRAPTEDLGAPSRQYLSTLEGGRQHNTLYRIEHSRKTSSISHICPTCQASHSSKQLPVSRN